ncbi:hypothetical protein GGS26DRAFT_595618 [Hypomontagnella submonticulosa]|nr:hypothetical protein GGS26DRAFT_595618 [Hypomontagnella submonticulosa]
MLYVIGEIPLPGTPGRFQNWNLGQMYNERGDAGEKAKADANRWIEFLKVTVDGIKARDYKATKAEPGDNAGVLRPLLQSTVGMLEETPQNRVTASTVLKNVQDIEKRYTQPMPQKALEEGYAGEPGI